MNVLRNRLESQSFPDLGSMMDGYARAAVELGNEGFRQRLDYSAESIDSLDEILVQVSESPELDLDFEAEPRDEPARQPDGHGRRRGHR